MAGEGRPARPLAPAEPQSQQHYDDVDVDEQQLDERQFDELCQRYGPSHLSDRLAAAPAVAQETIVEIRFDKGYPEFSDGTSYNGVGVTNATDAASGAETKMSRQMRNKLPPAV
ncbi:hypothetical protein CFC21_099715 [Triticum aestivum]|uniref:Uncharacterized protein n=2 Tax=Triticum aestivum TaxID=4565 RepID=A0A3B6RQB3_WHEAT|nr:hypothetical protein CFC21_099715 [Triticum aestivum]